MKTLAERLEIAMAGPPKVRSIDLANACKVKPPSVSDWRSGKTKNLEGMNLLLAAKFLNVSPSWLGSGKGPMRAEAPDSNVFAYGVLSPAPKLIESSGVPVVGTVQGGDDGYLVEMEYPVGQGDGSLSHYSKDENAYGLRVKGDSMRPRIMPGEFIVCEPNRGVNPGDNVMVALFDGRRMVKEFLWRRDGEISFGSVNDAHHPITVDESMIEKMHYVAAIMPRGAFINELKQTKSEIQLAMEKLCTPQEGDW